VPLAAAVAELDAVGAYFVRTHRVRLVVPAVVGTQLELVGEVGVGGEREPGGGGLAPVAGEPDAFVQLASLDGLFAENGVRGRLLAGAVRREDGGSMGVGGGHQYRRGGAVDGELPAAEMPRVTYEQALGNRPFGLRAGQRPAGRAAHVAGGAQHGEGAFVHEQTVLGRIHGSGSFLGLG
jgi:hypothetical protein